MFSPSRQGCTLSCLTRIARLAADSARVRQSVLEAKVCCSYCEVVVTVISSPRILVLRVVTDTI